MSVDQDRRHIATKLREAAGLVEQGLMAAEFEIRADPLPPEIDLPAPAPDGRQEVVLTLHGDFVWTFKGRGHTP
jgi:hypothetical protein